MDNFAVGQIVEDIDELATVEAVTVSDGVRRFGSGGFEVFLLIPALLMVSPLSGIPLFTTLCGTVIFLVAFQGALGRERLWLPERVMRYHVPSERLRKASGPMAWLAAKLDRITRPRLQILVSKPARQVIFLICAAVAPIFPLLEFVPLSGSILAAGVALFALALLAKDGLMVLAGMAMVIAAAAIPVTIVSAAV